MAQDLPLVSPLVVSSRFSMTLAPGLEGPAGQGRAGGISRTCFLQETLRAITLDEAPHPAILVQPMQHSISGIWAKYAVKCSGRANAHATTATACLCVPGSIGWAVSMLQCVQQTSDGAYKDSLYLPVHRLLQLCVARLHLACNSASVFHLAKAFALRSAWFRLKMVFSRATLRQARSLATWRRASSCSLSCVTACIHHNMRWAGMAGNQ